MQETDGTESIMKNLKEHREKLGEQKAENERNQPFPIFPIYFIPMVFQCLSAGSRGTQVAP